jgi:hypothetical protein
MNNRRQQPLAKSATSVNSAAHSQQKKIFAGLDPSSGPMSEFKLVVAYDDFGHASCARCFIERLVESLGKILTFIPCFLKFEELSMPHVGERLTREVALADMVVIVAYEHADLPDPMEEWLRSWETTKRIEGRQLLALVSTSHRGNRRGTPVQSCLLQVARRIGMKFVLQATPLSKTGCRVADATSKARRSADERRGTGRNLRGSSGSLGNAAWRPDTGERSADLLPTDVTKAIVKIMQARQRKAQFPTVPLANRRCLRPLEANRNRMLTDL